MGAARAWLHSNRHRWAKAQQRPQKGPPGGGALQTSTDDCCTAPLLSEYMGLHRGAQRPPPAPTQPFPPALTHPPPYTAPPHAAHLCLQCCAQCAGRPR